MNIVIYGSRRQENCFEQVRNFIYGLVSRGNDVMVHEKLYDHLIGELGMRSAGISRVFSCPDNADLAISLGGDGTFLRTAAWLGTLSVPILGINTGHLGYLTAMTLDEATECLESIEKLDFRRERLPLIQVEAPGVPKSTAALNEVVVAKDDSSSMISAQAKLNGSLLARYTADGLIVSTPTGSTAYNLSVGGPILQPGTSVWVVSPIAAHSLTLRPLVVNDDAEMTITVTGRGSRFRLVVDGRAVSLPLGSTVRLFKSAHTVINLQPYNRSFIDIIGSKLSFNG